MRLTTRLLASLVAVAALWSIDVPDQGPLRLGFGREAHAIIGLPMSPLSVAGVARRTAYRTTAAVATTEAATAAAAAAPKPAPAPAPAHPGAPAVGSIVTTLPPGCAQTKLNGVDYERCGSTYYKASFMGPNLVFVVAQP